jgi:hypothetical protein
LRAEDPEERNKIPMSVSAIRDAEKGSSNGCPSMYPPKTLIRTRVTIPDFESSLKVEKSETRLAVRVDI